MERSGQGSPLDYPTHLPLPPRLATPEAWADRTRGTCRDCLPVAYTHKMM